MNAAALNSHLISDSQGRSGDDPIFALNAEATRRAKAGESIVNATLGALMEDDGRLATMPVVFETLAAVPPDKAAAYAPIAGEPRFLAAVIKDLYGESQLAQDSVAAATPGGTGALHHAVVNFLAPGEALLTPSYYWGPYRTIAQHTGRRVETFLMFDGHGAFNVSAFPSLARSALRGPESVRPLLRRAVKFQFLAGLPLSVGLFILAPRVVPLLLKGEDFRAAGIALRVISSGLVLIFLNLMARYVLTALDSQRAYFRAIVAGLVANAAVSVALIGRFGAAGACVGLLAGELTVLILCQRALARWMPAGDLFRELARPLLAAFAMGVAVYLLRDAPLALVPVAGVVVYAIAVVMIRALSPEEMRLLQRVYISFHLPGSARMLRAADRS